MKRFILSALLLCFVAFPARGEGVQSTGVSSDVPADSTLYRLVTSAFDDARLTARLELDTYRWSQRIPLIDGIMHDGQPLDERLRPATIYLGGLEVGAEFRALRLFGWFRFNMGNKNVGLLPSEHTRVRFENGGAAAGDLATPELKAYGARMEYAPTVWKNLLLGGGLSYHFRSEYVPPASGPNPAGIRVESSTNLFSLYVPVRYRFAWGALHAKAGVSLFGSHDSKYDLGIAYSNPPEPGKLEKLYWYFKSVDPHAWSAEVGAAVPVYGFMLRPSLHVKRLWLEGAYSETVGGLKLQVGLPF